MEASNKVTIRKQGRYYRCTNESMFNNINDSWFHHEKLEDIKNHYINRGFQVTIELI